uniref:Uncharacterized protein n=1 Tax=Pristionchus pacificus TaxID=54126 RepID=A0A2A6BBS7_PRIPA|eukprot:PDM63314.1 hypothetical protein PRIPAC_50529 [Pristionchus pacificus]
MRERAAEAAKGVKRESGNSKLRFASFLLSIGWIIGGKLVMATITGTSKEEMRRCTYYFSPSPLQPLHDNTLRKDLRKTDLTMVLMPFSLSLRRLGLYLRTRTMESSLFTLLARREMLSLVTGVPLIERISSPLLTPWTSAEDPGRTFETEVPEKKRPKKPVSPLSLLLLLRSLLPVGDSGGQHFLNYRYSIMFPKCHPLISNIRSLGRQAREHENG